MREGNSVCSAVKKHTQRNRDPWETHLNTDGWFIHWGHAAHPAVGRGAMCVAWGQEHYRTFDNKVYTFTGACTYTLARDCSLNTFTVNVINDRNCQPGASCKRELDLYLGGSKVRRGGHFVVLPLFGMSLPSTGKQGREIRFV